MMIKVLLGPRSACDASLRQEQASSFRRALTGGFAAIMTTGEGSVRAGIPLPVDLLPTAYFD